MHLIVYLNTKCLFFLQVRNFTDISMSISFFLIKILPLKINIHLNYRTIVFISLNTYNFRKRNLTLALRERPALSSAGHSAAATLTCRPQPAMLSGALKADAAPHRLLSSTQDHPLTAPSQFLLLKKRSLGEKTTFGANQRQFNLWF